MMLSLTCPLDLIHPPSDDVIPDLSLDLIHPTSDGVIPDLSPGPDKLLSGGVPAHPPSDGVIPDLSPGPDPPSQ